jgi:hypothetical protein
MKINYKLLKIRYKPISFKDIKCDIANRAVMSRGARGSVWIGFEAKTHPIQK